jgi:hypothetical protein
LMAYASQDTLRSQLHHLRAIFGEEPTLGLSDSA